MAPNGTLTYTPAPNQHGTATITLHAQDNGGTADGGVNVQPQQTFTITVTAVNDPPTAPGRDYGPNSLQANMQRSIVPASGLLVGRHRSPTTCRQSGLDAGLHRRHCQRRRPGRWHDHGDDRWRRQR